MEEKPELEKKKKVLFFLKKGKVKNESCPFKRQINAHRQTVLHNNRRMDGWVNK